MSTVVYGSPEYLVALERLRRGEIGSISLGSSVSSRWTDEDGGVVYTPGRSWKNTVAAVSVGGAA